jgi:polysaccharide export outer membrane protein
MLSRSIAALLACLIFSSCGDPPPSEYPTQQIYAQDTTLGAGDVFEVRVYRQEEMTGTYNVNDTGSISFPLIGEVQVSGKTPAAVETEIRTRLADGYLKNPQVSVLVKEYNSKKLSVFGEVRKTGTFAYVAGMTIVDAVSQAGGFTDMARKNAVTVTRKGEKKSENFTVPVESIGKGKAANFYVRPGDVVFVPRRVW